MRKSIWFIDCYISQFHIQVLIDRVECATDTENYVLSSKKCSTLDRFSIRLQRLFLQAT